MATNYTTLAGKEKFSKSKSRTPQHSPIPGREAEMAQNNAGGYSFVADDWSRLNRFLILGVTGNTLYQTQTSLIKENADLIDRLLLLDGERVVDAAAEVLRESRAIKVDAPLFVLAVASAHADDKVRARALAVLPGSIRIPTHLYTYVGYVNSMRGWGRGLKKAVGRYYSDTPTARLAMHAWKYKSRDGWSHRDVLRLVHTNTEDETRNAVLRYMSRGDIPVGDDAALAQIAAAEELLHTTDASVATRLIQQHRLTREAVPTSLLNDRKVWEALLEEMPITAMIRNLGKMSSLGMTTICSDTEKLIVERLNDQTRIEKSRIHPMNVLIALKQYACGKGNRGSLSWNPNVNINDALDNAFYAAIGNVEATGKRILLAGDDSGSMRFQQIGNVGGVSAAEMAAAMMLVTYMVEPNAAMITYATSYTEITVSRKMTVATLLQHFGRGGGTNTALPLRYAIDKKIDFDAIVSYTDNETWAGYNYSYHGGRWQESMDGHVTELLRDYQNSVGHPVRFVNAAMTASSTTDVDPGNPNMLETVGFDSSTPQIIGEFVAGRV